MPELKTALAGLPSVIPNPATDTVAYLNAAGELRQCLIDDLPASALNIAAQYPVSNYSSSISSAVTTLSSTPADLLIDVDVTVAADLTVPSNIRITPVNGAKITVASGKVLTINSLAPAGDVQIFAGSGTVRLMPNAAPELRLAWWGGTDPATDKTAAFNAVIANVLSNLGGTIVLPDNIVKVTGALTDLPNSTIIRGQGSDRDGAGRTIIQLSNLSASYIFRVRGGKRHYTFKDITVDLSTSTTCSAFQADLADGESTGDICFDNFRVRGTGASGVAQLYFSPNSVTAEIQSVRFLNGCQFVTGQGTSAVRCKTSNSWFYFGQPTFSMDANAVGLELDSIGALEMHQPLFVGTGTLGYTDTLNRTIAASITTGTKNVTLTSGTFTQSDLGQKITIAGAVTNSYIDSITDATHCTIHDNATATVAGASTNIYRQSGATTMPKAALWVKGNHGNIAVYGSQDEGIQNFIINDASDLDGNISVYDSFPQAPVQINQSGVFNFIACRLWSQILNDAAASGSIVRVMGGYLSNLTWGTSRVLLSPALWGVKAGGSFTAIDTASRASSFASGRRQTFAMPTDFKHTYQEYVGLPETTVPVVGAATAFVDKPCFRFGQIDQVTSEWTQYFEIGRATSGRAFFNGNQAGFKGYDFDSDLRAAALSVSTATVITPGASANLDAGSGNVFTLTPNSNITLNLTNIPRSNQPLVIEILTSGTTSYTITFGTNFVSQGTLATGTVTAKRFMVTFITLPDASKAIETSRTAAM